MFARAKTMDDAYLRILGEEALIHVAAHPDTPEITVVQRLMNANLSLVYEVHEGMFMFEVNC